MGAVVTLSGDRIYYEVQPEASLGVWFSYAGAGWATVATS